MNQEYAESTPQILECEVKGKPPLERLLCRLSNFDEKRISFEWMESAPVSWMMDLDECLGKR
jgi:hypothetical protein